MTKLPISKAREHTNYGDPASELVALKQSAAIVDPSHKTILRLSGKDPLGMLDAILTNAVPREEALGVYAALLDRKGRVQTDLRALKSGEDVLIITEPEGAEAAQEILGRYAPFSRVKLEDLSEAEPPWAILGLYGPRSKELIGGLELSEHQSADVTLDGVSVLAAGAAVPVPGYDLLGPADALRSIREGLLEKGAAPAGQDAFETARIEAGIPRFGSDVTPDNFPNEAVIFLQRAVSFEKGCYPGQETVARMRYRGHPNKTLYRFELENNPAEQTKPGHEILQGDKKAIGWITSAAPLPVDEKLFALGYLSRKADPDSPMRTASAEARSAHPV